MVQFVLRPSSMRPWLRYVSWGSLHHAASNLMGLVRFGYNMCPCDHNLELYMQQDASAMMMADSDGGDNHIARNSVDYALASSTNITMANMANSLNQFINYGENIKECGQFQAYILTYTGINEDQTIYLVMIMVGYFLMALVLMFAAMGLLYRRRT